MAHQTFEGYLVLNPFFWKNSSDIIWPIAWRNKGVQTFLKDNNSKVKVKP